MCGAEKAENRGEWRGKREEEGELGRTRTRVRQTRYSGAKIKEVFVLRLMKGQGGHLRETTFLNFVSWVPSLSDPSPSLGVERNVWKPPPQEIEPSVKSPDGRGQRTLKNERAS